MGSLKGAKTFSITTLFILGIFARLGITVYSVIELNVIMLRVAFFIVMVSVILLSVVI